MKRFFVSVVCLLVLLVSNIDVLAKQLNLQNTDGGPAIVDREFEGRVIARERVEYRNDTTENLAILWLVEEGAQVGEGDLLVRLDSSLIEDRVGQAKIQVDVFKASLYKSEFELEVAKTSVDSYRRELAAKLALIGSREKLLFSKNGEIAVSREVLESTILFESERSKLIRKKISQFDSEEKDEDLAFHELKFELVDSQTKSRIATTKLSHLNDVFEAHQKNELECEMQFAESEGRRDIAQAELRIKESESKVATLIAELQLAQVELDRLINEIQACEILATQAGVVCYSKQESLLPDVLIEEGTLVQPHQTILYLPNLESLGVQIEVPESLVGQLKVGQEVTISNDVVDDFRGQVSSIANWPSSQLSSEGKGVYEVVVSFSSREHVKIGQLFQVKLNLD